VSVWLGAGGSVFCGKRKEGLGRGLIAASGATKTVVAEPILDYVFTEHALRELRRRGLDQQDIDEVLTKPGQRFDVRPGRVVLQSKMRRDRSEYLLRVFVDIDRSPAEVVTSYQTSKVDKYWRDDS